MEKIFYATKVSPDVVQKLRGFCSQHGITQSYFVENAIKEKLQQEEAVQDVLELKRWRHQEPQAISPEAYIKQRNVRS